jgi:hypothetical protein
MTLWRFEGEELGEHKRKGLINKVFPTGVGGGRKLVLGTGVLSPGRSNRGRMRTKQRI